MNNLHSSLREVKLFAGLRESEYDGALACLNAKVKKHTKGSILQLAGDPVKTVGIVLSGSVGISRTDYAGNRLIVGRTGPHEMLGEAIAFAGNRLSPVTLTVLEDASLLTLDFKNLMKGSAFECRHSRTVVTNLLGMMAEKICF